VNADRVRVAAVGDLPLRQGDDAGNAGRRCSARSRSGRRCSPSARPDGHTGTAEEAKLLVRELAIAKVTVVAVLGNHDYESEKADEVKKILADAGSPCSTAIPSRSAGWLRRSQGLAGGFGERRCRSWVSRSSSGFVRERWRRRSSSRARWRGCARPIASR